MNKAYRYSLADFLLNDSRSIYEPPADFEEWITSPEIQRFISFYEQQFLDAPRSLTELLCKFDSKRRKVINLTSYNYLGLSTHPEVIIAVIEAVKKYGLGAAGAPMLSGTFDIHEKFRKMLAEFKRKEDCLIYSSGFGERLLVK